MPPVLLEQSFRPTFPQAPTLAKAVLWDSIVTLELDHETTIDLIANDTKSESRTIAPPSPATITFDGLHALHAQNVRVDVEGVTFSQPLRPSIQQDARIEIGGSQASLAAHITALLHDLIADSPFASHELSLECRYSYPVADLHALLPILLVTRQEVANESIPALAEQCATAIQEWRTMASPPAEAASLIYSITFWTVQSPDAVPDATPLLRLTNVSLAISDIA